MDKKEIGKRLKLRRIELDMTQGNIADQIGVAISTIQRYEAGTIDRMKMPVVEAIARTIKVNPDWLVGKSNEMIPREKEILSSSANSAVRINVYGSVPAGVPIEAIEDVVDWEDIPQEWVKCGQEYIGLKVKGNSMSPKYLDGDTVIVRLQPDCENGQDCVVYVNGYDSTLKKVVKRGNGILLQPLNPDYLPEQHDYNDEVNPVTIVGVVVEIRRKV